MITLFLHKKVSRLSLNELFLILLINEICIYKYIKQNVYFGKFSVITI